MPTKQVSGLFTAWKVPRWRWALLIAMVSDGLGFVVVLLPPAQWLLDAVTALALLVILGFRWPLLVALGIEVIPAVAVFPAWTLVVLAMSADRSWKATGDQSASHSETDQ
jgi:hypothetical protein